jgi:hypothetical protein
MFIVEHNRNLSVLLDTFPTLREGLSFQDLVDIFPVGLRSHLLLGVVRSFLLFVFCAFVVHHLTLLLSLLLLLLLLLLRSASSISLLFDQQFAQGISGYHLD